MLGQAEESTTTTYGASGNVSLGRVFGECAERLEADLSKLICRMLKLGIQQWDQIVASSPVRGLKLLDRDRRSYS